MCGPGRRIPASGPNPVTTSRPGRRTRAGAESFFQEPIPRTRPRPPRYRPGSGTSPAPGTADPGDHSPPCRSASPNLPRPVRRPRLSGLSIRPDSRQLRMRAASAPHATAYPHRKSHHRPHAPLRLLPFPPANRPYIRRPARSESGSPGCHPFRSPPHTYVAPPGPYPLRPLSLPPTHTAPGPDPAPVRPILPIPFAPFSLYSASFSRLLLRAFPFPKIFSIGNLFYRKINTTFVPLSLTNNDENA